MKILKYLLLLLVVALIAGFLACIMVTIQPSDSYDVKRSKVS